MFVHFPLHIEKFLGTYVDYLATKYQELVAWLATTSLWDLSSPEELNDNNDHGSCNSLPLQ